MTVNTTLSGGGQPPSPRKSSGLVDDCRLRPVCYAYPLVKVALSRDIDRRTVYRISDRYPLSNLGTAYSGTPPVIGTCFGCRVSAAGYLPQRAENNQLRGISGLVSRLYLGFYIPLRKEFGSSKFEPYGNVKKRAVGKHPKSEKRGNTAQFSEVERSGTQENCGGIGSGGLLRLRPLPVLRRRQSQRVARIDPNAVVVDKNIAENDRFDLFSR